MNEYAVHPVAVVGIAAIMPSARDGDAFWANIKGGRYCITDVPPERWDPASYYSPDRTARDKTYSMIGGWVREFDWDPIAWRLPIPPTVAGQMDEGQRWALSAARRALLDAGWPSWNIDNERVAVILGNAIGGEKHYVSSMRIRLPEALRRLQESPTLLTLPPDTQHDIVEETRSRFLDNALEITEDTMPGELSNVIAGRISNVLNLRGPNFTTDAACASGLAALSSAVLGLNDHQYDAVISGGIDRNMGVDAFVKFSKIGALSASGTRPFDAGADGFVMGEGAALFVLKRLEDAERDGDRIYSVILSIGGSSDGKGKGITAPNPIGQQLAVSRAWERSGVDPATVGAIEAHGTSTSVGDAAELESLATIFGAAGVAPGTIALGSVKSNIGHLKAAAGTAGLYKMVRSLHEKVLAPSLNFVNPNENVDWDTTPCAVNTRLRDWPTPDSGVRRAGVSAFGFGGTNFHIVLEEHVPGAHQPPPRVMASAAVPNGAVLASSESVASTPSPAGPAPATAKAPLRGALVIGGRDDADVLAQVRSALAEAHAGTAPAPAAPDPAHANAAVRVAVDYADAAELAGKLDKLAKGLASGNPAVFRMLRQQGVFLGRGPAPKLAFLYTGQGSQYVNMVKDLYEREPIVQRTFAEADRVMAPLLGRPLTSFIFVDPHDEDAVKTANQQLMQTEITQPAVLATDLALTRLLAAYQIKPDMVMGHSLGEYGALVAAGSLDFDAALEAVSARGREMANLSVPDNGAMAAVFGPLPEIERIVAEAEGYVVIANINSYSQAVVGGATEPVERIVEAFQAAGMNAVRIPVSHAFHTEIVAPASPAFIKSLRRLDMVGPKLPIVANVTGEFYPADADTELMLDFAGRQIASPVQFVKGLQTLYDAGARVFVEVGPKKALHGFVEDVLTAHHDDVLALFTNHPKVADDVAVNQALCGLYAAGHGFAPAATTAAAPPGSEPSTSATVIAAPAPPPTVSTPAAPADPPSDEVIRELGQLFAGVLEQGLRLYGYPSAPSEPAYRQEAPEPSPAPPPAAAPTTYEPIVITGAGIGLPGVERTFDDENVARILAGQQFITPLPQHVRERLADMNITRLVKDASGGGSFQTIDDPAEVIKLAGRTAPVDLVAQYGLDTARDEALDETTRLAIAAGFEALHDAGIPLAMQYKTTTLGTQLPDRWGLPEALRDDTGIIFPSAFPGYDRFAEAVEGYAIDRTRRENLLALEGVRARMSGTEPAAAEVDRLIAQLREALERERFVFDRRFIFRVLSMGHAQFAEIIGARGPNTQTNSACASTTQALSLAEDWIRSGRCRRVVIISADNATGEHILPWVTGGFLASGAAATDERVEDAATPFDRRRHGMIVGSGAAAIVLESAAAARERGIQPICEVLAAVTANSAFHGSRLDVEHIGGVMDALVAEAEQRGVDRADIAARTVFVSHETYTPARGGSASAEVFALRRIFGEGADRVVITNTKGLTGHAMGAGIEDVVAVKSLETGIVPPVVNFKEPDPELGPLNLSTGGDYPVEYALRLAAGFGSQIAMTLMRWTPLPDKRHRRPNELGYAYRIVDADTWQGWLDRLSGRPGSTVEVDHRRLRIVDRGAPDVPVTRRTHVPVPYAGRLAPAAPAAPGGVVPETVSSAAVAAETATVPVRPAPAAEPAVASVPVSPVSPQTVAPGEDPVLGQVTAIVADLTGYPPDLLDPDLDLEADLGVDTVKQAEVFASVRAHYGVERDDTLQLRDFPTLNHVAAWVRAKAGLPVPAGGAPWAGPAGPSAQGAQPVATPAPQPVQVAVPAPADADDVIDVVVGIVAKLTGYPPDLLDPDLDLEADLGVDTVKQAEVFAAVRAHYGVERDDTLQLRDFPTINHVAAWIRAKTGATAPVPSAGNGAGPPATVPATPGTPSVAAAAAPTAVLEASVGEDDVVGTVVRIVAELTGYPPDLLDPDLDLEADLGVDTVKQAEVFAAVRAEYGVERDDTLQLRDFPTINHVAAWIRARAGIAVPAGSTPWAAPATPVVATAPAAAPTSAAPRDAAPSVPSAPVGTTQDEVLDTVVRIVAELTGYPPDLLDPDLDLEADLGVDTVKQAEVFAAVRAEYGVERDDTLQLRDFPTINHVAAWIRAKRDGAAASPPTGDGSDGLPTPTTGPVEPAPTVAETVRGDLRAIDALPRRIPVPILRPGLERCLPTGVTLAGARVLVQLDEGGVGEALVKRLDKAGAVALTLPSGIPTDELSAQLDQWLADGPIAGVYWLAALDDEGSHDELDLPTWTEALRRRVKALYTTMRRLWDDAPFLISATRLGGQHGYGADGATSPMGGAVTGFTKSYQKERPDTLVKAVDLPASRKTAAVADLLIEETLQDPGSVEIGRLDGHRWGVGYAQVPFPQLGEDGSPAGPGGLPLTAETVFLVTGAAGSIVSAITADLAKASGGTFHLLDLTPAPDPADPDLVAFLADKESLKTRIAARMRDRGERPTPVVIERELAHLERKAAALTAIQSVQAAGGTAFYHSVDLTDPEAVASVMAEVAARSGRIDVLLHAAGLEVSHNLPDKEPAEFDLVFDVKTTGWFTVWAAAMGMPVGATVVFSSVAGRFGNQGQTDYAAANDLLCKLTSAMRRQRPQTRALALDWTAWGGIGMATRGSIPKIMQLAGVQLLPPEAGVAWVRRELSATAYTGEVIVAGALGQMAAEAHPTGGADPARLAGHEPRGPMVGDVSLSATDGLVVRVTLDPARQPFLYDHRIDGTPVLPGVMGIEGFAEAAALAAPEGFRVGVVEDVEFLAPVKFFRDEARTITVTARVEPGSSAGELLARCTLSAERLLPGHDAPTRTTHFTGTVRLVRTTSEAPPAAVEPISTQPAGRSLGRDEVYALYFHGPAYQVVEQGWRDGDRSVSRLTDQLPANHDPGDAPLQGAPRLAELCFQTAGLWEAGSDGRMALPLAVKRLELLRDPSTATAPIYAWARPVGPSTFDCAVVDSDGALLLQMDGYRSIELPGQLPGQVTEALHATYVDPS